MDLEDMAQTVRIATIHRKSPPPVGGPTGVGPMKNPSQSPPSQNSHPLPNVENVKNVQNGMKPMMIQTEPGFSGDPPQNHSIPVFSPTSPNPMIIHHSGHREIPSNVSHMASQRMNVARMELSKQRDEKQKQQQDALYYASTGIVPIHVQLETEKKEMEIFVNSILANNEMDPIVNELVRARMLAANSVHEISKLSAENQYLQQRLLQYQEMQKTSIPTGMDFTTLSASEFMRMKLTIETTFKKMQKDEERRSLCSDCHQHKSTVMMYPCKHQCLCQQCGLKVKKNASKCLVCHQIITDTVVLNLAV